MEHRVPYKHTVCLNTHPRPPGVGPKVKTVFFLKVVMLHIKLMEKEHRAPCKHLFCPYTHLGPWVGPKDQNIFTESSHAAYQIKGYDGCRNMQARIFCPSTPFSTPGVGSKVKTYSFLKVVMLHIKLIGMELREPCKPYTHAQTPDGVKSSRHCFTERSHVAYHLAGRDSYLLFFN